MVLVSFGDTFIAVTQLGPFGGRSAVAPLSLSAADKSPDNPVSSRRVFPSYRQSHSANLLLSRSETVEILVHSVFTDADLVGYLSYDFPMPQFDAEQTTGVAVQLAAVDVQRDRQPAACSGVTSRVTVGQSMPSSAAISWRWWPSITFPVGSAGRDMIPSAGSIRPGRPARVR
jgi:hypothetical protein